jgi:transcriptional regulator with XRE-family HTH domain
MGLMTHTPNRRARLAGEIRQLMEAQGKSPAELASAAGISLAQIDHRLAGLRPFDIEELDAVAGAFGCRGSDLTRLTDVAA